MFVADTSQETHYLGNNELEKKNSNYADSKTAMTRIRVEYAELTIQQEQEDMSAAEIVG